MNIYIYTNIIDWISIACPSVPDAQADNIFNILIFNLNL